MAATAGQLLRGGEPDDSDIVQQTPLGAGRSGPAPEPLRGRTPYEEAELIADRLADALADGVWGVGGGGEGCGRIG